MTGIYFVSCNNDKPKDKTSKTVSPKANNKTVEPNTIQPVIAKDNKDKLPLMPAAPNDPNDIIRIFHEKDAINETLQQFKKCFSKYIYLVHKVSRNLKTKLKTSDNKVLELSESQVKFEDLGNFLELTEDNGIQGFATLIMMFASSTPYAKLLNIDMRQIRQDIQLIQEDSNSIYVIDPETGVRIDIIKIEGNTLYIEKVFEYNFVDNVVNILNIDNTNLYNIVKETVGAKVISFGSKNQAYKETKNKITINFNEVDSTIIRLEDKYLPKLLIDSIKQYMKSNKFNVIKAIYAVDSMKIIEDLKRLIIEQSNSNISDKEINEKLQQGILTWLFKTIIPADSKANAQELILTKA